MPGIIITLSIIAISAVLIAYTASRRLHSLEQRFNRLDEYLHSKILADQSGAYSGVFLPVNDEIVKYREWERGVRRTYCV